MKKIISTVLILFVCIISINVCYATDEEVLLQSLTINQEGLTPEFSPEIFYYSLFLKDSVNSIDVEAKADGESKIEITGNNNLKMGDNEVIVTLTPKNGEKKEYKIIVTKTNNSEASDSYLQNLILENIKLSPAFLPETLEYDGGTVPNKINNIFTFAASRQEGAPVVISGNDNLKVGENIISVKVTSVDGTTNKEYKVRIVKETEEESKSNAVDVEKDIAEGTLKKKSKFNYKALIIAIVILVCVIILVPILAKRKNNDKKKK